MTATCNGRRHRQARRARLSATVSVAALLASAASAEQARGDAADAVNPPATMGGNAATLGEIVVTAQRRSEKLMNVPLSVTAFNGAALKSAGVSDTSALQVATPGLIYSKEGTSVQFYIRGVGNETPTPGVESSVAFYVDGVYRSQMIGSFDDFADLDRVEVLQGPQGTLYGRNALGGAINVTTKDPSLARVAADISATFGNYGRKEGKIYFSAPLNNRIAFSIAAARVGTDGWARNLYTGKTVENENYYNVRLKLAADIGGDTHIVIAGDRFWRHDTRNEVFGVGDARPVAAVLPQASVLAASLPPGPEKDLLNTVADRPALFTDGKWTVYNDGGPLERDVDQGISLKLTHNFPYFSATSLTAYRDLTAYSRADADGTNRPLQVVFSDPQTGRTFTQDLHLASRRDLFGISWLAGASFLHDASGYSPVRFPMPILGPLQGIGSELDINGQIQTEAVAGYAQVTYHILRNLSLTGGLRYNSETKKITRQDVILPSFGLTIPNRGAPSEKTWDSLAVHAGIEYKPWTDWLVYFSYDQGFKSGSFNVTDPRPPVPCTQNASGFCMVPVNQEEINAYQGGVKGRLLDGRAEVELTGFYYDYTNLQTSVVGPNGSPILQNAANATIYGLDFKLRAAITHNLTIQAAGTELFDAKYDRFVGLSFVENLVNGGFTPVTADMSGNRLPRSPRFTGNVGPVYTTQIGSSKLILSSNLYYSSSYYLDPSHLARVGSYALWSARAEYKLANGLSFAVWGRNLTQERFVQSALFLTSELQSWNEPRMFGLTVSYEY